VCINSENHNVVLGAVQAKETSTTELFKMMRKIQAMCGNPDAAAACRNILAECETILGDKK